MRKNDSDRHTGIDQCRVDDRRLEYREIDQGVARSEQPTDSDEAAEAGSHSRPVRPEKRHDEGRHKQY